MDKSSTPDQEKDNWLRFNGDSTDIEPEFVSEMDADEVLYDSMDDPYEDY